MTLLHPTAAKARAQEKQKTLLRFLRDNKWTTQENVQRLLGLGSRQAAHKTLIQMEAGGLIRRHSIDGPIGAAITIWGITVHGIMVSFGEHEPISDARAFEPSKLSVTQLQHHLGLQEIQIRLEAAGWHGWTRESLKRRNDIVPDATVTHPNGWPVAIEYERSLKSLRRYHTILLGHLVARKKGLYRDVYYITPDKSIQDRLMRIFNSIKGLRHQGQTVALTPELLAPFHFYALSTPFENVAS
ncbi:MAG: replication-relaxation family protein [Alphaproteobacteria bacterium]|nr:replication-relaxation family protein [Alphaproteobacteria bacterium]